MENCLIHHCGLTQIQWAEYAGLICRTVWQRTTVFFSGVHERAGQNELSHEAVNQRAEQILNTYGNSILRYAYSYLHNMSDAEEVLQDTLIRFLRTSPVFENERHEKAWLLRVAGNLSKNRRQYNAVRNTDELNEELASEKREDLSFVWEAVKELPPKYREVIHLYYHEGCCTREIADILKKKEATVRSDLHRGRNRLKVILKEAYDFE